MDLNEAFKVDRFSEQQVRNMRDLVYGHRSSDLNWEGCRDHWLKPEATFWLLKRKEVQQSHLINPSARASREPHLVDVVHSTWIGFYFLFTFIF